MHSSPVSVIMRYQVTVHTPLSREVFWHEYAKIPSCSVMEQFADIRVDRVNIQMEAEDADRTEI